MDITIIGTGNMGRAIATRALAGGHTVTLLGTDKAKAETVAAELSGEVRTGAVGDPLTGDVVVLAVWYQALGDVLARYGDQLDGKVVVDITNPVDPATFQPISVEAGSAAQEIAGKAPGAKVAKAFNTTFAGTLAVGQPLDVFTASDDDDAKAAVSQIVIDAGLHAVDVGPLRRARELEGMGYLHMAITQGTDAPFATAMKVVS
jgi:8-hydroxy-5-deazaflavin:NADPH oxidoreductase